MYPSALALFPLNREDIAQQHPFPSLTQQTPSLAENLNPPSLLKHSISYLPTANASPSRTAQLLPYSRASPQFSQPASASTPSILLALNPSRAHPLPRLPSTAAPTTNPPPQADSSDPCQPPPLSSAATARSSLLLPQRQPASLLPSTNSAITPSPTSPHLAAVPYSHALIATPPLIAYLPAQRQAQ